MGMMVILFCSFRSIVLKQFIGGGWGGEDKAEVDG